MTEQEMKTMDRLNARRQKLTKLMLETGRPAPDGGRIVNRQEQLEYNSLYDAITAIVTQMNELAEASCARTIASLRSRKQVMADFLKLHGGSQTA